MGVIFTGEILPAIAYLTQIIPGGENQVLIYCLPSSAVIGGYRSLIEASKNMITAGIAERAGYRITKIFRLPCPSDH